MSQRQNRIVTQLFGALFQLTSNLKSYNKKKQSHLLHMQTIGMASEVPVLLPVRQLNPDWVATFLVDDLGDELWRCYVDHIEGAEPGAPDGPINISLNAL